MAWDGLSCWAAVPPSSVLQRSCRLLLLNIDEAANTLLSSRMHHLYDGKASKDVGGISIRIMACKLLPGAVKESELSWSLP